MNFSTLTPLEIQDLVNKYRSDLRKLEFQVQHTASLLQQLEQAAAQAEEALAVAPAVTAPTAAPKPTRGRGRGPAKKEAAPKPKATGRRGRPPKAAAATDAAKKETTETTATAEIKETPKAKTTRGRKPGRPKKEVPAKKETKATAGKETVDKKEVPAKKEAKPKAPKETKTKAAKKEAEAPGYRLSPIDQFVADSLKSQQKALITADFVDLAKDNPAIKGGEAQVKVKLNRSLHKLANKKGILVKVEYPGRGFAYALNEWVNAKGELPKKYAR